MTSFCTSPYSDTGCVVLAQVDQRVLLGQLGQRGVQRAAVRRRDRLDHRLQAGRREVLPPARRRRADRVADPHPGQARAAARSRPARTAGRRSVSPRVEDPHRR